MSKRVLIANGEVIDDTFIEDFISTPDALPILLMNILDEFDEGIELKRFNIYETHPEFEELDNMEIRLTSELLKKGKYDVSATYDGNKNYTGNNTTQKLTIKEKVIVAEPASSSNDPGAYYSRQSMKTYYTGDIVQEPGGGYVRHLGNNKWEPI